MLLFKRSLVQPNSRRRHNETDCREDDIRNFSPRRHLKSTLSSTSRTETEKIGVACCYVRKKCAGSSSQCRSSENTSTGLPSSSFLNQIMGSSPLNEFSRHEGL